MNNKPWPIDFTEDQLNELHAMLKDKAFTHADIAKVYGVKDGVISYYAIKHNIRRQMKVRGAKPVLAPSKGLRDIEAELEEAATQERALKQRIADLQQKRSELSIRFEVNGPDVLVYGIADGGAALSAPATSWLTFLNANGGGRLREFIQTNFKKGGVR